MSKKRGVVHSTTDHTKSIAKSKSAHTNPIPQMTNQHTLNQKATNGGSKSGDIEPLAAQQLAESNLLSQEPERMVNQAYYTYQDPDREYPQNSDRYEENDQYVIESMQKKKELQQKYKKELEKQLNDKKKPKQELPMTKKNNTIRPHNQESKKQDKLFKLNTKSGNHRSFKNTQLIQKCNRHFCKQFEIQVCQNIQTHHHKELNSERLKPRPLNFNVNMFDKAYLHSPHRQKKQLIEQTNAKIDKGLEQKGHSNAQNIETDYEISPTYTGQNINTRKLPFRFQGYS